MSEFLDNSLNIMNNCLIGPDAKCQFAVIKEYEICLVLNLCVEDVL